METYNECRLCPRNCGVNRSLKKGYCQVTAQVRVALTALHYGEEPPLAGAGGSGTIFFSGCQLRCPFCQNWQISRGDHGREITIQKLASLMLQLQQAGAANINLVTGTPFIPAIAAALKDARINGLTVPAVWNSGGYEEVNMLRLLKDDVRIYLPDLKTLNKTSGQQLYAAGDYAEKTLAMLNYLLDNFPLQWNGALLRQGVIIRHLVLPGYLAETAAVLAWFARHAKGRALLSLLTQYTPVAIPGEQRVIPQRSLNRTEEEELIAMLKRYDIEEGFFQDLINDCSWLPDFNKPNPFAGELARTLWPGDCEEAEC
jgi:putative pyruvate formate lyase activating enzyme